MTSGPVVGLELVAAGAVGRWRQLIGPTDSSRARQEAPQSLRALFGKDGTDNACHGSDAAATAAAEAAFFFGPTGPKASARCDGSTSLALVKPAALAQGTAGLIVDHIQVRHPLVGS